MATERYSFSLTTFSPSGKLVQIEYALAAVAAGAPSIGIKAVNGVVIATENKHKSILYDEHSVNKVEMITKHIGMVYSGMGPDYRLLVKQARKMAQQYFLVYKEPIPTVQLVQRVAAVMQEYTQSGGVRPFGVSLLICGWDYDRPYLFQCDPSGAYFAWKATAMGKNFVNGKTFLEKRYSEDLELDDAVHTAILTLKESFEGQMTVDNIEVGICDANGFRRLDPSNVKDYLMPHVPTKEIQDAKSTYMAILELSQLLNTNLDAEALSICIQLCESGVNPDALAACIRELSKAAKKHKGNGVSNDDVENRNN